MATKLRLQRHGRKKQAYYYIVAADSRAPRDGRFIERIGSYNPNTNPATIELNLEKAVSWLDTGAEPSDTVRAILSYKGALMMHHLHGGIRKGALTQEQADAKFAAWVEQKAGKVEGKKDDLTKAKADVLSSRMKAEIAIKDAKAAAIAAKNTPPADEPVAEETSAEATEEVAAEAPATEAPKAETPAVEETKAEAPVAEAPKEEAPVAEAPVAETPATDAEATTENTEA